MASTLNLMQTNLWAGGYVHFQPLTIGGDEPTVTNANLVKSTILGAPFAWPWNRVEPTAIQCAAGTQDYTVSLPTFGFLEKAWITLGGVTTEISIKRALSKDTTQGQPDSISTQLDDGQGNLTFRLMPSPSAAYLLNLSFQQKSPLMTSLANRWDPIPDELGYIYQPGYLAMCMLLTGDARFPIFNDRFLSGLLGAQDGLDETQRNIFLANWLEVTRQVQRSGLQTQQGVQARAK